MRLFPKLLSGLYLMIAMSFILPASSQAQSYSASYKFLKAIKEDNYRDIKMLIEKGVNVNTRDYDEKITPLIMAARKKNPSLVQYLLNSGAKPDLYGDDGQTPLMIAARLGDKLSLALLITNKANLDIADKNGETALIKAVLFRKKDLMVLLLGAGSDHTIEDYSGRTALAHAKETRRRNLIKVLTEAGAEY